MQVMCLQEFAKEMEQAEEAEASERRRAEQLDAELLQVYAFHHAFVWCTRTLCSAPCVSERQM